MKSLVKVIAGMLILVSCGLFAQDVELSVTNNLILRLDASDVMANGTSVSNWNNQAEGSVISADFVQTDSAAQPTLVADALNGHPVLEFDGTSDHFFNLTDSAWEWNWDATSNAVDAARWTVFFVCKPDVKTGNRFLLRSGYNDYSEGPTTAGNTALWGAWFVNDAYSIHCRNTFQAWYDARWSDNVDFEWHILGGVIQNITDPSIMCYLDGDLKASRIENTTRQMGGHIRTRIGASSTQTYADEFFDGQLAEVLVYKDVLTDSEMVEVNTYLAEKYGFNDPYHKLYCRMDDEYVMRNGTNAPPALTTDDGDWTVVDQIEPAENGTAESTNTTSKVLSSATGVIGEAIQFSDATSGEHRVDFGDADSLEPGDGSFTASLWLKPTALGTTQFVASHGNAGSGSDGWSIWLTGTTLSFRLNSGNINDNAHKSQLYYAGLQNGQWYHAVLVIDRSSNTLRGYIDGSSDDITENPNWDASFEPATITSRNYSLLLGARCTPDAEFKGYVDDFSIWKRVLSTNEIAEIYQTGLKGRSFMDPPPPSGTLILVQ